MRVPWTARRSSQSILKEISPGCSLEGPVLKLKLQYFGHLMQKADSFEKTLMHGGVSAPSCCAFTHMVAFEEGSGPRVLLKGGPGNRQNGLVGSPCSPRDSQESSPTPQSKASILRCSAFFTVQLSHPYMTTGKT